MRRGVVLVFFVVFFFNLFWITLDEARNTKDFLNMYRVAFLTEYLNYLLTSESGMG